MLKLSIWKYIKNYKFNSLFIKNFILILMLIIIPLIGISMAVYGFYDAVLREEVGTAQKNSLSRVRDMIDMISKEADMLSVHIASDNSVEKFLNSKKEIFPKYESVTILQNVLSTISITASDYIDSIYVYSDLNDYILSSVRGGMPLSDFFDSDWYEDYNGKKEEKISRWVIYRTFSRSRIDYHYISTFYKAPFNSMYKKGVVIVNISTDRIKDVISQAGQNDEERIYITDGEDIILFAYEEELIGKPANQILGMDDLLNQTESVIKNVDGNRSVFSIVQSNHNNWKFISVAPMKIYNEKTDALKSFILISILISIIVSLLVGFFISVRVFMPIKKIMDTLEEPDKYLKSGVLTENGSLNEYKYIVMNILKSFDKNRVMEDELNQRIYMLKNAQTIALQSQISPHFLNNTLQTISWLTIKLTKGENNATRVINSLSEILRAIMETENTLIPIKDEIYYVNNYLKIQQIRYQNMFDAVWDIEDEILDYRIAKITLQPIIENAIYHGIKPIKTNGLITIKGVSAGNNIIFEIADNGPGMKEEQIEKLNSELERDYIQGNQHIGIKNVNQRIKLIFGQEYGITLANGKERGLVVKIVIQKLK